MNLLFTPCGLMLKMRTDPQAFRLQAICQGGFFTVKIQQS